MATGFFGNAPRAKLSRADVAEIRQWARTDGFGLSIAEQARHLHRKYPQVKPSVKGAGAVCDVLRNLSFYDPSYRWDLPILVPPDDTPQSAWLCLWLVTWLLIYRSLGPLPMDLPLLNPTWYDATEWS